MSSISSFTPTPAEVALANTIFTLADPQKLGVVTGEAAVSIFSGADLAPHTLGEIWTLADSDNNGFLSRKGMAIALRLIGWAQSGETTMNASLITKPGPMATIKGVPTPRVAAGLGSPPPKSPTPSTAAAALPPVTADDRAKFMRLFVKCGPVSGLLTAEKARDVFIRSKLPVEKLGQIWNLADTRQRGSLDSTDFAIGMYFIQVSMSGQISTIPTSLPPGFYEQISGGKPFDGGGIATHLTGGSLGSPSLTGTFPTSPSLYPQLTGQSAIKQQVTGSGILKPTYTGQPLNTPPLKPNYTGQSLNTAPSAQSRLSVASTATTTSTFSSQTSFQPSGWDVKPEEKAGFDRFFDTLDTQRRGFIEGEVAVPFMLQSSLPENDLAQIWDLADIKQDGQLTKDEFAVAMHLIHAKLAGNPIPATLPPGLVPPSLRPPVQTEITRDLFSFDDSPTATVAPQQPPAVASPPRPTPAFSSAFHSSSGRNLLDDDDDDAVTPAAKINPSSFELGNLQNQLSSTERSLASTKAERSSIENNVATSASTLAQLESQLAASKASYDTESRLLSDVKERYAQQSAQIQTTREELIRAESDLSGLRVEKAEVGGALLRDRDEVRDLQRKMKETSDETEALKKELEKLKKDARHQKGLLAIHKKQLAGVESEKSKAAKEVNDAKKELEEAEAEVKKAQEELEAAGAPDITPTTNGVLTPSSVPLPSSPPELVSSPSSVRSNNPFDRFGFGGAAASNTPSAFLPFAPSLDSSATAPPTENAASASTEFDLFADSIGDSADTQDEPEATPLAKPSEVPPASPPTVLTSPVALDHSVGTGSPEQTFVTPPQSATFADGKEERDNSLLAAAESHFPALDGTDDLAGKEKEADLPPLEEIEAEDDSSSEGEGGSDDEDNVPLEVLKRRSKTPEVLLAGATKPVEDSNVLSTDSVNGGIETSAAEGKKPLPNFNDLFADPVAPAAKTSPSQSAFAPSTTSGEKDAFGANLFGSPTSPAFPSSTTATSPAGSTIPPAIFTALGPSFGANGSAALTDEPKSGTVTDFDEAFGKVAPHGQTGTGASNSTTFTFDSAFDDDFDFATAKASVPADGQVNGTPMTGTASSATSNLTAGSFLKPFTNGNSQAKETKQPLSFDDIFENKGGIGTSGTGSTVGLGVAANEPAASIGAGMLSFDDAFETPAPAAGTNSAMTGTVTSTTTTSSHPPRAMSPSSLQSPTQMSNSSVRMPSPTPGSGTPPRAKSPKPRSPSPQPPTGRSPSRSLSMKIGNGSSSKGAASQSEGKEGQSKSKLHIHFPFGRSKDKKNKKSSTDNIKNSPSTSSGAPTLPPRGSMVGSPLGDDDIEDVRTLVGMGFTRAQAVAALEAQGYDVQKALNSLLGAA